MEQRGIALTKKGRQPYDALLNEARNGVLPDAGGSNAGEYEDNLQKTFLAFPDDWNEIRREGLGYFSYSLAGSVPISAFSGVPDIESLIEAGVIQFDPIVYEDFLPVSAAGIFQSNLGDETGQNFAASPSQKLFEEALGSTVLDEFAHYEAIEAESIERCFAALAEETAL